MPRASKTMLNTIGNSRHPCPFPNLEGVLSFFTVEYDVGCRMVILFNSVAHSCPTFCNPTDLAGCQAFLYFTNSQSLINLMFIESVMPFNHLILCLPVLLLPSIFSIIRVFLISWFFTTGAHWSFSFSISLSNECSGLIFFRIDWFDLLAV